MNITVFILMLFVTFVASDGKSNNQEYFGSRTDSVECNECQKKLMECQQGKPSKETESKVQATCTYKSDGSFEYICFANNFNIRNENTAMLEPTGKHEPKKTNKNITNFSILNQNIIALPKNIVDVFPSITKLIVRKSNLIYLDNPTIGSMKNLKVLDLKRNLIKTIPIGVFDFNFHLETVDLSENQIKLLPPLLFKNQLNLSFFAVAANKISAINTDLFIGTPKLSTLLFNNNTITFIHEKVFGNLRELSLIDLRFNTCVNESYSGSAIEDLYSSIATMCNDDEPCVD